MIWLLVGCGVAAPSTGVESTAEVEPAPGAPPVEDVRLTVGRAPETVTVQVAGAWIDGEQGRGVDATAVVAGPPELVITGSKTAWDLAKGVVVFSGDVHATRGDLVLDCARFEVAYAGDRITRAEASGGLTVSQGARSVTAAHAVLTPVDGRLVLDGEPVVTDGPNRLAGDTVTLWLDDDRLECDRCRLVVDGRALE